MTSANGGKKAILVVGFGTTYQDAREKTIEEVGKRIRESFPGYEVRQAFTSRIVGKRILQRDGVKIETEAEAIERLKEEGYREVIVQPLHIVAGEEFEKVKDTVKDFKKAEAFTKIVLCRPLLYYVGQEKKPDDYQAVVESIVKQAPEYREGEAVLLQAHEGVHPANSAYGALQLKLIDAGCKNIYVYTVKGYPALENVIKKLQADNVKKVILMPLMLAAGFHAADDMAGDKPDSAKNILQRAGFEVGIYFRGLGENQSVQDIYVQHIKDAMEEN